MAKRRCDEIDYRIHGHDLQVIEIELDRGETVVAEPGAALFFDDGITFDTCFNDGSHPEAGFFGSLISAAKRRVVGESLVMTHFKHEAADDNKRCVFFSAPYPGRIVPIDLGELGCNLFCSKEAFLCAARGTQLTVGFQTNLGAAFWGGSGFIMQKLIGDGMVFVHGGGAIIERELRAGQIVHAEPGSVVAYSETVDFSVKASGGLKTMFMGGEGAVLAHLTGPGKVWIQSSPFTKLCGSIYDAVRPSVREDAKAVVDELRPLPSKLSGVIDALAPRSKL